MRHDAALGCDEAPVGLVRHLHVGGERVGRKPARHLGACQHLVLEVVLGAGAENPVEDPLAALDDPRHVEELLARLRLELAPELVRPPKQRHVVRVLEVREPDDPREAV